MPGRHRSGGVARTPLVIAAVAVVATGTVVVVQTLADAGGCSSDSGVELTVAADPAVAPVLREVAADWTANAEPAIDGRCVAVEVTDATTAEVASVLAAEAGGSVDVATPTPEPGALDGPPAVWVPDSSYWITQLQAISRTLFAADTRPLATSPVVIAATPPAADVLGAEPVPPTAVAELVGQDLPLSVAEPRRDTAGLVGAVWMQTAMAPDETDLPAAVALFRGLGEVSPDSRTLLGALGDEIAAAPVSEQAVIAHNEAQPAVPVTAVPVIDAPALDFPYATVASKPRNVQTAAGMFRNALIGAGDVFARHGFRATDGSAAGGFRIGRGVTDAPVPVLPIGPAEQVSSVLRIWISSRSDARVLSIVNVNASMLEPMGPEDGPRRIDVFQATAEQGLELFTPNSELGVWEYGTGWEEAVPMATLTDEHKGEVLAATAAMQAGPSNDSAMFEALLAGYQAMKEGYDHGRSNTLLLWTDGGDSLTGELTLEQALRELERLVDVTRPIRVILLGLGPTADMAQLEAIATTTGGGAYHLLDPDQIGLIFLQALLT